MASVIASNIPKDADEAEIKDFFSIGYETADLEEITPLDENHEMRTVRIHFHEAKHLSNALLLNGTDFKDSTIRVVEESGGITSKAAEAN